MALLSTILGRIHRTKFSANWFHILKRLLFKSNFKFWQHHSLKNENLKWRRAIMSPCNLSIDQQYFSIFFLKFVSFKVIFFNALEFIMCLRKLGNAIANKKSIHEIRYVAVTISYVQSSRDSLVTSFSPK